MNLIITLFSYVFYTDMFVYWKSKQTDKEVASAFLKILPILGIRLFAGTLRFYDVTINAKLLVA